MAYDGGLAERLRETYGNFPELVERKMFGGLVFMVYGHMSCGVLADELIVLVGPEQYHQALQHAHAREMDFTGRSLSGFVIVDEEGFQSDQDLSCWVQRSLDFVSALPPK